MLATVLVQRRIKKALNRCPFIHGKRPGRREETKCSKSDGAAKENRDGTTTANASSPGRKCKRGR